MEGGTEAGGRGGRCEEIFFFGGGGGGQKNDRGKGRGTEDWGER